jgi:Predicted membrane protein
VMEGKAIRSKDMDEEELQAEPMPAGVTRFIDDDQELEDEELLGESTLKYLGSKQPKSSELEEDLDEELGEVEEIEAEPEAEPEAEEPAAEPEDETDEDLEDAEEEAEEPTDDVDQD